MSTPNDEGSKKCSTIKIKLRVDGIFKIVKTCFSKISGESLNPILVKQVTEKIKMPHCISCVISTRRFIWFTWNYYHIPFRAYL